MAAPALRHLIGIKAPYLSIANNIQFPLFEILAGFCSLFVSSSPIRIGYLDAGKKFVNDDDGVPVDYELDKDSWYDLTKSNAFVSGLSNEQSN